jgi:hypothetical protein
VAVGNTAGSTSQGTNAVAIGRQAGETNQHANSIILNGSGAALNSDGTSRFYVNPVRNTVSETTFLAYNATTSEVTYTNTFSTLTATNLAGTLTTAAQPNVTSLGTLTSLDVTGTVTAANLAGALTTAAQPNVTSLGTLTSLGVTGTATAGNINTTGSYQISGTTFFRRFGNNTIAIGSNAGNAGTATNSIVIGTNAGSVATNSGVIILNASGAALNSDGTSRFYVNPVRNTVSETTFLAYNATTSEVTYTNTFSSLTATNLAGTLTTAAQPNVTSLGTLTSLSVTGAASAGTMSLQSIANTTTSNVLYYDTTTKAVTYGAVPAAPVISSFWLATNTQITTSNTIQNLGSITLAVGTYLLQVYGQASGTGLTQTEIWLDPTSAAISANGRKNGYPYDNRTQTASFQYLQATTVVTLASSTTLYLNGRAFSTQLGVNFTCWVANDTGVTATKLG